MNEIIMFLQYDVLRKLLMLPPELEIKHTIELPDVKDGFTLILYSDEFSEEFLSRVEGNVYLYTAPEPIDDEVRSEILAFLKSKGIDNVAKLQGLITQ